MGRAATSSTYSLSVDATFRMDGTVMKSECAGRARHGFHDRVLCRPWRARGRHVDGLFEERAVQWIRLVEDREDLERPFGQCAFDRVLATGNEGFDQHVVVSAFTLCGVGGLDNRLTRAIASALADRRHELHPDYPKAPTV